VKFGCKFCISQKETALLKQIISYINIDTVIFDTIEVLVKKILVFGNIIPHLHSHYHIY